MINGHLEIFAISIFSPNATLFIKTITNYSNYHLDIPKVAKADELKLSVPR